jgi:hypothetical protein
MNIKELGSFAVYANRSGNTESALAALSEAARRTTISGRLKRKKSRRKGGARKK